MINFSPLRIDASVLSGTNSAHTEELSKFDYTQARNHLNMTFFAATVGDDTLTFVHINPEVGMSTAYTDATLQYRDTIMHDRLAIIRQRLMSHSSTSFLSQLSQAWGDRRMLHPFPRCVSFDFSANSAINVRIGEPSEYVDTKSGIHGEKALPFIAISLITSALVMSHIDYREARTLDAFFKYQKSLIEQNKDQ